jgi:hypothetical protein
VDSTEENFAEVRRYFAALSADQLDFALPSLTVALAFGGSTRILREVYYVRFGNVLCEDSTEEDNAVQLDRLMRGCLRVLAMNPPDVFARSSGRLYIV